MLFNLKREGLHRTLANTLKSPLLQLSESTSTADVALALNKASKILTRPGKINTLLSPHPPRNVPLPFIVHAPEAR